MSILAIIPARGGSKGIPRKNIKLLADKPLIGWTIDAATRAYCVDRVIVSTEDEEIASVARKLGAEVPFMRPVELAADETPSIAPVLDAIERLPKYDWVLLLQPTSPLRSHTDIEAIWELCQANDAHSAVSVTEVSEHPYLMYERDGGDCLKPIIKRRPHVTRRQDFPEAYALNGAIYLAKTDWLSNNQSFVGPETLGYLMPSERSLDIDTQQDWRWAEFLIHEKNG